MNKNMKGKKRNWDRNHEIVSIRMKSWIKEELDELCFEMDISRSNFILNSVVKEISNCKGKKGKENRKKLENINIIQIYLSKNRKNNNLKRLSMSS